MRDHLRSESICRTRGTWVRILLVSNVYPFFVYLFHPVKVRAKRCVGSLAMEPTVCLKEPEFGLRTEFRNGTDHTRQ